MLKFFRIPFATSGDRAAVPDAPAVGGAVSYSEGYGNNYQLPPDNPSALNIERDKMNALLFDLSTALGEIQAKGITDFITTALNGGSPYSYSKNAVVRYSDGNLYASLEDSNAALPTDDTKWARCDQILRSAATQFDLTAVEQPTSAVTAVVNATAGNLTGAYYYRVTFVTALGETESSVPSTVVNPSGERVNLSAIPVSSDPLVTARRIYRTPAGAADSVLCRLAATINDNSTTTYTDNLADAGLGSAAPYSNTTGGSVFLNGDEVAALGSITTKFGWRAHPANTGYANSAFGANALFANTTGYRNTAYGVFSFTNNTTGARNTGVGVHAGDANTTGNDNTAVGYGTLQKCTIVSGLTAIGSSALSENTSGTNNTGLGFAALQLNTTGSGNVAGGTYALFGVNGGSGNTAFGSFAGYSGPGNFNTYVGNTAGYTQTSGDSNTGVGFQVLYSNVSGGGNVALGVSAGYWETGFNHLWIDNTQRANLADARTKALMYGTFDTAPEDQQLTINGLLTPSVGLALPLSAAVTGTTHTQAVTESALTFNGSASTTLTLLSGAKYAGRLLMVRNTAAFTVVSASANIIPLAGGAASTALLAATAGKWALLQADATAANWTILMAN